MPLKPQLARCTLDACIYRDMFDAVSDILYVRDLKGVILDINEAGARFFGLPKSALVGKTFHREPADDRAMSLMESNLALLENGGDRSLVELVDATGRRRIFEASTTALRDRLTGQLSGAFGIMRETLGPSAGESVRSVEVHEANATTPIPPQGDVPTTRTPTVRGRHPDPLDDAISGPMESQISDWLPPEGR